MAKTYKKLLRAIQSSYGLLLFLQLGIIVLGLWSQTQIVIKSNILDLLPESSLNVKNLKQVNTEIGGTSFLYLVVHGHEEAQKEYIRLSSEALEKLATVNYVIDQFPIEYFSKFSPYFMDLSDWKEMLRRVEKSYRNSKKGGSVVFSGFLDITDEEDSAKLDLSDIEKKYRERYQEAPWSKQDKKDGKLLEDGPEASQLESQLKREGYLYNRGFDFFVIMIKPKKTAYDLDASRRLIAEVEAQLTQINQRDFQGKIEWNLTGNYKTIITQSSYLRKQFLRVTVIVAVLIVLALCLYFKSLFLPFIIFFTLLSSICLSSFVMYLLTGSINFISGFSAIILLGLGSDYGIHLLKRYLQERESKQNLFEALWVAFSKTGASILGSSLTTFFGFLVLIFSQLKGFSEMGLFGAIGTLANLISALFFMPVWLTLAEKMKLFSGKKQEKLERKSFSYLWTLLSRLRYPTLIFSLFVVAYSLSDFKKSVELDFNVADLENREKVSSMLFGRVKQTLKHPLRSPVILFSSDLSEQVNYALAKKQKQAGDNSLLRYYLSFKSLNPEQQKEKLALFPVFLSKFKKLKIPEDKSRDSLIAKVEYLVKHQKLIEFSDIPPDLVKVFRPNLGKASIESPHQAVLYLIPSKNLKTQTDLDGFSSTFQTIKLENGKVLSPAGEPFILSEMLGIVEVEGPLMFIGILSSIFIVLVLQFFSLKKGLLVFVPIVLSALFFIAAMKFFALRFNVLNVSMIPIIFAVGIDNFIHFFHRYTENSDVALTWKSIMSPISISNLTSVIGFGGFIFSSSEIMRSMGYLAILGLIAIFLCTSLFFPHWISLFSSKFNSKSSS